MCVIHLPIKEDNLSPPLPDGLFQTLANRLPTTAHIELSRDRFFLEVINLPNNVLDKKTAVFVNDQLQVTQQFNRTAAQTRLATEAGWDKFRRVPRRGVCNNTPLLSPPLRPSGSLFAHNRQRHRPTSELRCRPTMMK